MKNTNSLTAFAKTPQFRQTHHNKILNALKHLKTPSTYNEIAYWLGWFNTGKVSKRLPELVRLGKVVIKESRKCKKGGNECATYVLSKEMVEQLNNEV